MCYSSSIAAALGKEIKLCAFTGGLDVYLFLASLFDLVLLAGLLFSVTRLVTAKVVLVSLGVFVQVFALWSASSPWVSGEVQLLAGLCSLCSAWFFAQSAPLEHTSAFLQAQVVSLHDILRYSNERTAALCAELREAQVALAAKDSIVHDLQAVVDLKDNTICDPDATLAGGDSEIDDIVTALHSLRAESAENTILLSNARDAYDATWEAEKMLDAKVDQLKADVEEVKKAMIAQREEPEETAREIAAIRAIITRCEARNTRRNREIARKDRMIGAHEKELANLQKELVNTQRELANTQCELTDTQNALKDAQEVIGPISTQFEEYDADNRHIRDKLEAKLMLRDMVIESLKMQLASALTQTGAQPQYDVGPLDTSDSAESTLYSPPRPAQLSSSLDRSSLTSPPTKPSPPSPIQPSSSSSHRSTSPVRSCLPIEEPSFVVEDKLAKMDVSCDLLRDEFSFISKDQDSHWMQESPVKGKCALKPEEAGASGHRSPCSEKSYFQMQIPTIGVSRDLLHDKDSFLAQDKDSHWLKDTPEKPKVVVKAQDVPAGVESSLCADGKKSSFVMRLDDVSCDLPNDKMSIPGPKGEDSAWSLDDSLMKHLPPIKSKKGMSRMSPAHKSSWGEPRAAGDKSSFVMRVDDMSCDLLRANIAFLPKNQGSSWLGDSKSSNMAIPSVFPRNSKGKEKPMSSGTTLQSGASFPSNLSNEFAKLVENASTPAKQSRHYTEGSPPQPTSPSFMTISSSMDAHAFASFRPHRSDTCFLTPASAARLPAEPMSPSPPQGSSKRARAKNLLKASASGTSLPLATNTPQEYAANVSPAVHSYV